MKCVIKGKLENGAVIAISGVRSLHYWSCIWRRPKVRRLAKGSSLAPITDGGTYNHRLTTHRVQSDNFPRASTRVSSLSRSYPSSSYYCIRFRKSTVPIFLPPRILTSLFPTNFSLRHLFQCPSKCFIKDLPCVNPMSQNRFNRFYIFYSTISFYTRLI